MIQSSNKTKACKTWEIRPASFCHGEGRGFESHRSRQFKSARNSDLELNKENVELEGPSKTGPLKTPQETSIKSIKFHKHCHWIVIDPKPTRQSKKPIYFELWRDFGLGWAHGPGHRSNFIPNALGPCRRGRLDHGR